MDQCLQNFAKKVKDPLGEVVFQRNKSRYGITVPVQGVCYIDRNVTDNGFLRDLLELLRRHDCNKEQILAVFKKYSDQIRVQDVTDNDFDYAVWFENDANNIYRYCFHEEEWPCDLSSFYTKRISGIDAVRKCKFADRRQKDFFGNDRGSGSDQKQNWKKE